MNSFNKTIKQGAELKKDVCFVDIVVYGEQAKHCAEYLPKGRGVIVDGGLKFRLWETPEGALLIKQWFELPEAEDALV